MSFALDMPGGIAFLAGVIWGAVVAGVPLVEIGIATLILRGSGICGAVRKTRVRDAS